MATKEKQLEREIEMKGGKKVENSPNAGKFYSAMQNLEYKNNSAIEDIVDNSIDAGANKIDISIKTINGDIVIEILDNGCGMDEETLDQALRFGSDTQHIDSTDLGKFGMGLTSASLSLGKKTTVITKTEDGKCYFSITDLDDIIIENQFIKYQGELIGINPIEYLPENHGTKVIIEKTNGVRDKNVSQWTNGLIKHMGRVFRKFLGVVDITINGKQVNPQDPLMLDNEETVIVVEDTCKINDSLSINYKIVNLPDFTEEKNDELKINPANQGFSILRNNREIDFAWLPKDVVRHASLNRLRGEISFTSELDGLMGIPVQKNKFEMEQAVYDILYTKIYPYIADIRRKSKKDKKVDKSEKINKILDELEDNINKKSKLLKTPKITKEKRNPRKITDGEIGKIKIDKPDIVKGTRIRNPKKVQVLDSIVAFDYIKGGTTGDIFTYDYENNKLIIEWNVDHPFYSRFIDGKENSDELAPLFYFAYCLVSAEHVEITSDEKEKIISNINNTLSQNMRGILA